MLPSDLPKKLQRFEVAENGCWNWTGSYFRARRGDRPRISKGKGRRVSAHREMYEALVGPIPPGLTLDHLCENPPCVNPAHLEPCTLAENKRRYYEFIKRGSNRVPRTQGSYACNRILPDATVLAIYRDQRGALAVAQEYGISRCTVLRIRRGASRARVTGHNASQGQPA